MTSGLRKVHKYAWLVLAIIIPIAVVLSIKDLGLLSSKNEPLVKFESAEKDVLEVAENDLIKASLIKKDKGNAVEIILKSSLKNSSSVVYSLNDKSEKGAFIGQLTATGIYNFDLKEPIKGIIIYDNLKEKLITKLRF